MIDVNQLLFIKELGAGLYGNVLLVCSKDDKSQLHALKVISKALLVQKDKV